MRRLTNRQSCSEAQPHRRGPVSVHQALLVYALALQALEAFNSSCLPLHLSALAVTAMRQHFKMASRCKTSSGKQGLLLCWMKQSHKAAQVA